MVIDNDFLLQAEYYCNVCDRKYGFDVLNDDFVFCDGDLIEVKSDDN